MKIIGYWVLKAMSIMVALALFMAGCAINETRPDTAVKFEPCPCAKKAAPMSVSVSGLVMEPDRYHGRSLYVWGRFMGWKGNCGGGPPETRRDWMMEHENACIYVSGPLPSGIRDVRDGEAIGKTVWVHGNIRIDANGVPYLKSSGK